MKKFAAIFLLSFLLVPAVSFAQREAISRREGFLLIWETIKRPAKEVKNLPYADVQPGNKGWIEISYAEKRGILDEEATFRPDDPLFLDDALKWLFRTRNVSRWDLMEDRHLPELLQKYPLADIADLEKGKEVTRAQLENFINKLDSLLKEEVHEISFYAGFFQGKGTAFGETFDKEQLTAAHRTFPHNTLVRVTNPDNGKWVTVRINDRGPYVDGRDMDLSEAAFKAISADGTTSAGVLRNVTFERLGDSHLVRGDKESYAAKVVFEEEIPDREAIAENKDNQNQPGESELSAGKETDLSTNANACGPFRTRYQKRITRGVQFRDGVPHLMDVGEKLSLQSDRSFVILSVTYPDGHADNAPVWVDAKNRYMFKMDQTGVYEFIVGTGTGRRRAMKVTVIDCSE